MRITVRLESYNGFYFVGSAMQPVEPGVVVVEAFGDIIYMGKMVDYQAIHDELDAITKQRALASINGFCESTQGKQRSVTIVEFTLASQSALIPLPNEEALIEWLDWCAGNLFEPHSLSVKLVYVNGEVEKRHYHVYADAIERVRNGDVFNGIDPSAMLAQEFYACNGIYGITSAEWTLMTTDGIVTTGEYVSPISQLEMEGELS